MKSVICGDSISMIKPAIGDQMTTTASKIGRKYTWDDYKNWPDGERWEIINGEAYSMTPAPTTKHQRISMQMTTSLVNYFRGKPCEPFYAPTDVVLDESNIVQPDLIVVCDKNKITEANIQGAPDLIIEILSPSTSLKDKREKKDVYERFGVKEYIIVNPMDDTLERYVLEDGQYGRQNIFNWDELFASKIFPGLEIGLKGVFGR